MPLNVFLKAYQSRGHSSGICGHLLLVRYINMQGKVHFTKVEDYWQLLDIPSNQIKIIQ